MARFRCRIGLHLWKEVRSRRPGKATYECEHCRARHLVTLPAQGQNDRTPSSSIAPSDEDEPRDLKVAQRRR